jgi:predicted helicase
MSSIVNNIEEYAKEVAELLKTGHAKEHAYRPALEQLMNSIEDVRSVNDPKKSAHGNPDMVFLKKSNLDVILGYAEAKDIDVSLDKAETTNQMRRYSGYDNLFLTNYLEFRFFLNGVKQNTVTIGNFTGTKVTFHPENYSMLADELQNFIDSKPETIRSGKRLALIMGAKARRIRDRINRKFIHDDISSEELGKIYSAMKELLVHDLTEDKFADMYSQTLVYGLFVARYNDTTKDTFSRREAIDLVPATNPFLKDFFNHIASTRFDKDLAQIVDELCEVFVVSDVHTLVQKHLRLFEVEDEKDPIIHFYEDFLKEYDPNERKKMGAYYTPIPVVRFIIRQVDEILKIEFGLPQGLADTTTVEHTTIDSGGKKYKHPISKVQVLDPAVGTATFLNETIKYIHGKFENQEGRWPAYARDNLVSRLHGFELMMAPYTIAHLKLGMTLRETGLEDLGKRLGVYLTNTLEMGEKQENTIFNALGLAETISHEAEEAAKIKNERPIMVVMGNPPYSSSSNNKSEYIQNLIKDYKKDLNERKINLDDDYIKFIRFAEDMIQKNGEGVMAMITNNSFIDGITHKQMRKHLLETFDKIHILDLHGNSKKKETTPDGGVDNNVFDIMQGVSIVLAVKKSKGRDRKVQNSELYHTEIYGKRNEKFDFLKNEVKFKKLEVVPPNYYFVPKDFSLESEHTENIKINTIFRKYSSGVQSAKDKFVTDIQNEKLLKRFKMFEDSTINELIESNYLDKDKTKQVKEDIDKGAVSIEKTLYRPFDIRSIMYSKNSQGVLWRPRHEVMSNMLKENLALTFSRNIEQKRSWADILVTDKVFTHHSLSIKEVNYIAPLYLYHEDGTKTSNLNETNLKKLTKNLKKEYKPEEILDYIYAELHSPKYREKYKEFLKIDFPRVSVPENDAHFSKMVEFGTNLRELHLMKSSLLDRYDTTYSEKGENQVDFIKFVDEKVYINDKQFFGNVPEVAWNYYIGGYQPAQKWLKDRKGTRLNNDELNHYQKIIKILIETDKVIKQIDMA